MVYALFSSIFTFVTAISNVRGFINTCVLGGRFANRWDTIGASQATTYDQFWLTPTSILSNIFVDVFDKLIVMEALKEWIIQDIFKKAKKWHYLTFSNIWAHLPGNVNFSPWITRYKSGLAMVNSFRYNFFKRIYNYKYN